MLRYALQKRLYPIAVEDVRRVHFRLEHQTLGIYEQMALSSLDLLLARIVPALSSHAGALHRLRIDYGRAGLGISLKAGAKLEEAYRTEPFLERLETSCPYRRKIVLCLGPNSLMRDCSAGIAFCHLLGHPLLKVV